MDTEEFKIFTEDGKFVVRLTSTFCSRMSPDYIIESTLNKSMKTIGGLSLIHGRRMKDNVINHWFFVTPLASKICVNSLIYACLYFSVFIYMPYYII